MSVLSRLLHPLSRPFCSLPNPNPNPNHPPISMRSTLKLLFKEEDPSKLAADFKRFSSSPRFRRKTGAYEVIIRRLAALGRPDAIEDILEHQKLYPADFSREIFAARLISLYGHAAMLGHALATFHDLPSLPSPRTSLSFNTLLTAFARAKDTDRMTDLFEKAPSFVPPVAPDTVSYNILISVLCEKGDLDAAFNTLDQMVPDLVTFNTLLNGFYRRGRFSDGEKIWVLMSERRINPDTMSYNAKLRGLVSNGKVSEAEEIVGELREVGLKPDTFTFNALIRGYCQDGDLNKAKKVFRELGKDECVPNRWTYETLISAHCKARQLDFALNLCNECINSGCFVDAGVLQEVVNELAGMNRLEAAKKLVKFGMTRKHLKNLKTPLSCLFA